jgi:hypothetical protein
VKLKKGERCPMHGGFQCCGREDERNPEQKKNWRRIGPGVYRIEDEHHPRGYRIRRSKAAMRTLLLIQAAKQRGCCYWCEEEFVEIGEIVPDHREPRGAGGAWRDDHEDNIVAAHATCNQEKGSKRIA